MNVDTALYNTHKPINLLSHDHNVSYINKSTINIILGISQVQLVNVAVNKVTSIARTDSHPQISYRKWGVKDYLVDGLRTATGSGSGCSGCFASNPVEGYWQVDLGQKYFVAYITIVGVTGEKISIFV